VSDPESKTVAATTLWRNRDFRLLFGAQIVSLTGGGVTTVGLALFAYQLTGGASATAVIGNALTLRILAFLLFSQPAGVIADRVSRKKILIAADVIRFGLLALFPFITTIWQVYALIFAINAVTAFFTPTFEASIPEVVGEEQYVGALSLSRVAVDVEAVAAPALAALLVALFGVRWVFWFDASTSSRRCSSPLQACRSSREHRRRSRSTPSCRMSRRGRGFCCASRHYGRHLL
jgi:NRE family putative nickel resistance protein-like MFS transporter